MINSRLIQAKSQSPQRPTLPVTACTVLGLKQTTVRDLTAVPSLHAGGGVSEGDGIRLGKPHPESQEEKSAFTSRERTRPRWVYRKAVKKELAKQDFDFLYDQKKGGLYFNENDADKGFGDGGIIAIIQGAPDLTMDNINLV